MKVLGIMALLALCVVALIALVPSDTLYAKPGSAAHALARGIYAAGTPEPTRVRAYRSYPAPTGLPGFWKYYQKRCDPGCHNSAPVATPGPTADARPEPSATPTRVRAYRSYPTPTGLPGFRKYYQKRCYPGCHSSAPVVTPVPSQVHPQGSALRVSAHLADQPNAHRPGSRPDSCSGQRNRLVCRT